MKKFFEYRENNKKKSAVIDKQEAADFSEILNAESHDQLYQALMTHFSSLADSPDFEPILETIVRSSINVELEDGNIVIYLEVDEDSDVSTSEDSEKYYDCPALFHQYNSIH